MTNKVKAAWIGFLAPVVLGWGFVMVVFLSEDFRSGSDWQGSATGMAMLFVGGPSILLGLMIAFVMAASTRNKLKCGKCGYSLVGLTSDRCPECGETLV